MIKQIITCDCCGNDMKENTGAELGGQLRYKGDLPVIQMSEICDDCAKVLYRAIMMVSGERKAGRTVEFK